ncbi:MAG: hypothetical protein ACSLE6_20220 [Mycobacterium sp.]
MIGRTYLRRPTAWATKRAAAVLVCLQMGARQLGRLGVDLKDTSADQIAAAPVKGEVSQ